MKVVNFVHGVKRLEEIQIEVDAYPGFLWTLSLINFIILSQILENVVFDRLHILVPIWLRRVDS